MLYRIASKLASFKGYELVSKRSDSAPPTYPIDFTADEVGIWEAVQRHTMTSPERIVSLVRAVRHVLRHAISGAIVECGVWKGGSMMAIARTLLQEGRKDRVLHLFDTFEGMSPPSKHDYSRKQNKSAAELLATQDPTTSTIWAVGPLDTVKTNLGSTGYPMDNVRFVQGRVEETLPREAPDRIALLRLDTDWYESTKHELIHLYPRLVPGGVLIIDDYGHWEGARKAVDEYLAERQIPLLLCRIDYTARIAVKPAP